MTPTTSQPLTTPTTPRDHSILASERDSLPFPAGGVHGPSVRNGHDSTTIDPSSALEHIERLQQRVDQLARLADEAFSDELDRIADVVAHIGHSTPDQDWPPTAA